MADPLFLLFTLINVVVTGLFAAVVLRQYVQRHRLYQLYWAIALLMAFFATVAYVLIIAVRPTSSAGITFFRLYYILGAALMPAWLGLGSIALVTSARVTRVCLLVLCVLSVLAIVFIATAGIDRQQLAQIAGTPGAGILRPENGPWLFTLITLNSLGVLAVVGVAIYSGWQLLRRQGSPHLLWGNGLILVGDLVNAYAGTNARLGVNNIFWIVMTVGWIIFFIGVLFASRSRSRASTSTQEHQGIAEGTVSNASSPSR